MKKIKFNIKMKPQIESGEYIAVLMDSTPVRIVCWDADPKFPVCCLVMDANQSYPILVGPDGNFYEDSEKNSWSDLFVLVPDENEGFVENKKPHRHVDLLSYEISSRFRYGLKVWVMNDDLPKVITGYYVHRGIDYNFCVELNSGTYCNVSLVKPYLRPLSDMTEEEWSELDEEIIKAGGIGYNHQYNDTTTIVYIDFMLKHHFDYRGLIDMRLALKAPKGIYDDIR